MENNNDYDIIDFDLNDITVADIDGYLPIINDNDDDNIVDDDDDGDDDYDEDDDDGDDDDDDDYNVYSSDYDNDEIDDQYYIVWEGKASAISKNGYNDYDSDESCDVADYDFVDSDEDDNQNSNKDSENDKDKNKWERIFRNNDSFHLINRSYQGVLMDEDKKLLMKSTNYKRTKRHSVTNVVLRERTLHNILKSFLLETASVKDLHINHTAFDSDFVTKRLIKGLVHQTVITRIRLFIP